MTTKELLTKHNVLAKRAGRATFKTWKGKKADLQTRVDELVKDELVKAALKTKKAKKDDAGETAINLAMTVADMARALGMHPKVARAKLRRRGFTAQDGRWPRYQPGTEDYEAVMNVLQ